MTADLKAPALLLPALRQYTHNHGEGFVFGYDKGETDRIVTGLIEDHNQQYAMKVKAREQRDKSAAPEVDPVKFCEDTALSLAERTLSTGVVEYLAEAEDIIQYARRLYLLYSAQPSERLVEASPLMSDKELEVARHCEWDNKRKRVHSILAVLRELGMREEKESNHDNQ